ncbi:DUF3050 domain-containing protein [Rudanella paleaurantiibacter]|uniref:DUF3050 domain-containing protein n=1 Tax=Rudanella paleaurantiibacter TaxID=2614655 RepID=A0A7J5TUU6_9BACT|nr:DUF3050 domain-containing protein [Rudanella paleaurantiibacter]KAB7727932.1 DUF3050 domain-containing protein [Rudanella paleaurantiibacter]
MSIDNLKAAIEPVRSELLQHEIYESVQDLSGLRDFARYHAFAVWDFMSLLKGLQIQLTCTSVPWVPVGNGSVRYLINEIVTGEESDETPDGRRLSHYELYLEAMEQMGADTAPVRQLVSEVAAGKPVRESLAYLNLPEGVRKFVEFTFDVIDTGKPHLVASVFTFGREDLIPNMFIEIVRQLDAGNGQLDTFRYYLERHIELDGDHHSHLAMQMVEELCGTDEAKWTEATDWTIRALQARIRLWDAVCAELSLVNG